MMVLFTIFLVVGCVVAIVFALSLAREKGALSERVKELETKAEIIRKQAEIMTQARTDDETIDRLDNGSF